MLQVVKIENQVGEERRNSVSHYILQQKVLKKLKTIEIPATTTYKPEEYSEILEERILNMNYENIQKAIQLNGTQFVDLIRHGSVIQL